MGLEDGEDREDGDQHLAALLEGREKRGDGVDLVALRLGEVADVANPVRHAVAELHHHAGGAEAAHRPGGGNLLEESDDQILCEVRERDAEHAQEEREVCERERLGALAASTG